MKQQICYFIWNTLNNLRKVFPEHTAKKKVAVFSSTISRDKHFPVIAVQTPREPFFPSLSMSICGYQ